MPIGVGPLFSPTVSRSGKVVSELVAFFGIEDTPATLAAPNIFNQAYYAIKTGPPQTLNHPD